MSKKENKKVQEEEIKDESQTTENTEEKELSKEEELEQSLQEEKDRYLRLFAEFENYKKRTIKERIELFKTANKEVIIDLLPVLDDFERGMKELEKQTDKKTVEGIKIIQNKLNDILKQKGLKPIEIKQGDDFDTDYQEAITQIPAPSDDLKSKVIDVVETGYELGEKVIRYAKVVIGQS